MPSRTTWFILIPSGAVSGLLLAIGVGSAWYVHRSNHIISASLDEQLSEAQAAERLVVATREVRLELSRFSSSSSLAHFDAAKGWFAVVESELPRSRIMDHSHAVDQLLKSVRSYFEWTPSKLSAPPTALQTEVLVNSISEIMLPYFENRLQDRQIQVREMSRRNQIIAQRIGIALVALGVCGAVAGILVGFGIAGSIHRSLVQISIPVQDMAGHLNEVVGPIVVEANAELSVLDESLRKLAEKTADVVQRLQISASQSARREQLAALGQLAAGLAHELRNPLMSVKLILQVAVERPDRQLKSKDLEVMQYEITRLESMLQTFLDFARPPLPRKTNLDLRLLAQAAVAVVQTRAIQQQVQLHVHDSSQTLALEADEMQFRQLLLNLLLNALDSLPYGGNIWLDLKRYEQSELSSSKNDDSVGPPGNFIASEAVTRQQAGGCVCISVSDDGAGIAPEVIENLFEPFVSTKVTGVGLGLSICRQIVEAHDGWITAKNRAGGGAEFRVFVPQPLVLQAVRPTVGSRHEAG